MIIDSNLRFSNAQAITASAVSTYVLDGKYIRKIGKGTPLYLNIYLNTAFTTTTDALTILLIASSGADPSYSTSPADKVLEVMPSRTAAVMQTTGLLARLALPCEIPYERIALWFLATTNLAVGKIDAFLTLGQDNDSKTTT
jgi:hypothetical protein